jgi:hypothetical protein
MKLAEVWEQFGGETTDALRELAGIHADLHPKLAMLENDPDRYRFQSYGQFFKGEQIEPDVMNQLATIANPGFPALLEQLRAQNDQVGHIDTVGEFLARGHSAIVIGPHGDITDPAFVEVGTKIILRENGYPSDTGLIVNKILGHLAYKLSDDGEPTPTVPLMQMGGDVWMTYPPSKRMRAKGLERLVTNTFNKNAKRRITRRLGQGGYALFVAASGETDKPLPEEPDTIELARVQPATASLMAGHIVLPVGVDLTSNTIGFAGNPTTLREPGEIDEMMGGIADWLNINVSQVTGKAYRYAA